MRAQQGQAGSAPWYLWFAAKETDCGPECMSLRKNLPRCSLLRLLGHVANRDLALLYRQVLLMAGRLGHFSPIVGVGFTAWRNSSACLPPKRKMASGTRPVIVSRSPVCIVQISQIMKAQTRDLEAAKADNVKLVERLRYVQGYRSSHHTRAGMPLLLGNCWLL